MASELQTVIRTQNPTVRAIREYYTRDQAQECVDAWNNLDTVEQSQHILACSSFRAMVIIAQETLRKDAELKQFINSEQWANMLEKRKNNEQ